MSSAAKEEEAVFWDMNGVVLWCVYSDNICDKQGLYIQLYICLLGLNC